MMTAFERAFRDFGVLVALRTEQRLALCQPALLSRLSKSQSGWWRLGLNRVNQTGHPTEEWLA